MIINWTKIIILIIIIAAFVGIIVGIILAFRSQCPDGKIYNKTCKKCVTKCESGYNLPTKDGGIDCDSETCKKDCGDQCNIDNDTCGENCGGKCCNTDNNQSCDYSSLVCVENNCPKGPNSEIFCEEGGSCITSPGTQAICSYGAKKCDNNLYTNKCGDELKGFCCPSQNPSCLISEDGENSYCCKKDEVISNDGCCPEEKRTKDGVCCSVGEKAYDNICCTQQPCNGICCQTDSKEECKYVDGKDQCVVSCPGVKDENGKEIDYCLLKNSSGINQFCMKNKDTGENECVTDQCNWSKTDYNPENTTDGKTLCKFTEVNNTDCSSNMPSEISGVWAYDWDYNGKMQGGIKNSYNACRTSQVTAGKTKTCSEKLCQEKIGEKLTFASWDENTGICTGTQDCSGLLPSKDSSKIPVGNCLSNGVCCTYGTCGNAKHGFWCLKEDEHCLINPCTDTDDSGCGKLCSNNLKANAKPGGISGITDKDEDWCEKNCAQGWGGQFCGQASCANVSCAHVVGPLPSDKCTKDSDCKKFSETDTCSIPPGATIGECGPYGPARAEWNYCTCIDNYGSCTLDLDACTNSHSKNGAGVSCCEPAPCSVDSLGCACNCKRNSVP